MYYKKAFITSLLTSIALGAYAPPEPWATLTPGSKLEGVTTDYKTPFGLAVIPFTVSEIKVKRNVISQINDGQVQVTTQKVPSAVSKIVSQIGDGQLQVTTAKNVVTKSTTSVSTATSTSIATATTIKTTIKTKTKTKTKTAISQIHDGQVQATTSSVSSKLDPSKRKPDPTKESGKETVVKVQACKNSGTLAITLHGGVLIDSKGRIGSIVGNRQFQFDGPPPQAGTIYAGGWSITKQGTLAIGDSDVFYQCLSGTFYNLYDKSIGGQCSPVHLQAVGLVDC
ncbi:hypothetical protein SUVZ_10G0460 [Saccharomyces uvarum]|uniref:Cell wall mannoprotein PIR1-like C-terminal domain-containing protein n=1 Tax=Saccharomyces uvarum TaxID=230603 RepID=A0ABN8WL25_SACUV|nr:hypothetical protein SUVZ_10G0460 [Saccharomyces uvarum]